MRGTARPRRRRGWRAKASPRRAAPRSGPPAGPGSCPGPPAPRSRPAPRTPPTPRSIRPGRRPGGAQRSLACLAAVLGRAAAGGLAAALMPRSAWRPGSGRGRPGLLVLVVLAPGGRCPGGPEQVVVALGVPQPHRVRRRLHAGLQRSQQLLLGPDQVLPAVVGDLVLVRHGQRAGRAGLHAQPAEDAAQVVDLVDGPVPLTRGVTLLRGVVRAFHVDGVGRAGPRAQLAADALLQAVRPAVELVTAVEPGRGGPFLLGVLDRVDLPEHLPEGHAKPLDRTKELRHR